MSGRLGRTSSAAAEYTRRRSGGRAAAQVCRALVAVLGVWLSAGGCALEPLRGSQAAFEAAGATYSSVCEASMELKTRASTANTECCSSGSDSTPGGQLLGHLNFTLVPPGVCGHSKFSGGQRGQEPARPHSWNLGDINSSIVGLTKGLRAGGGSILLTTDTCSHHWFLEYVSLTLLKNFGTLHGEQGRARKPARRGASGVYQAREG